MIVSSWRISAPRISLSCKQTNKAKQRKAKEKGLEFSFLRLHPWPWPTAKPNRSDHKPHKQISAVPKASIGLQYYLPRGEQSPSRTLSLSLSSFNLINHLSLQISTSAFFSVLPAYKTHRR
jgi:hypothetical protein